MSTKNVSPFGPAVWPAVDNIFINVLFYCLEEDINIQEYMFSCLKETDGFVNDLDFGFHVPGFSS